MDSEYLIFDKGFNKVLDLIGSVDNEAVNNYKKIVNIIPEEVLDAISGCEDFATDCAEFNVDFMRLVNAVSLDFSRNKNFIRTDIYVHRIFEDDLFKNNLSLKIFAINVRNTENKKPNIQLNYIQEKGGYKFVGTNDNANEKIIDYTFEIYLDSRDDQYFLVSVKSFRGVVLNTKEVEISFDELMCAVEDEDDCEDDCEVEFDADFDL